MNQANKFIPKIKVVIADDQRILSESLKLIIEQDEEIEVIGIADNGLEAIEMSEKLMPNVILMDLNMPLCNGIESTKAIKQKSDTVKIIIMTSYSGNDFISDAIGNGVDGYVMKDIFPYELKLAIKSVYTGLNVFNSDIFRTLWVTLLQLNKPKYVPDFELSTRETLILKLISEGKDNNQIAEIINLSVGRVANIISELLRTFNLENRICLAVFAIKNGLV